MVRGGTVCWLIVGGGVFWVGGGRCRVAFVISWRCGVVVGVVLLLFKCEFVVVEVGVGLCYSRSIPF